MADPGTTRNRRRAARPDRQAAAERNMGRLPEMCAACDVADNSVVMVVRGQDGFLPAAAGLDPDAYNREHGITPWQRQAMVMGAVFGWHVPAADPDFWLHDPSAAGWRNECASAAYAGTMGHLVDESEFPREAPTTRSRN